MAENKKSFVLYCDLIHTIEKLPDDKAGLLLKHLFRYVNDKDPITDDLIVEIAFEPIKHQLKRDLSKWDDKIDRLTEQGRLGGIKSGEARALKRKQNEAKASKNEANEPVNVNVNVNVNDTVNVNDINNINNWFLDFENGNQIIEIARINNLTVDFVKNKLLEFRAKAELEYPNYNKFVSHFKNWLNKNKVNMDKKEYKLYCANGPVYFTLTEDELIEMKKSGYYKEEHEI